MKTEFTSEEVKALRVQLTEVSLTEVWRISSTNSGLDDRAVEETIGRLCYVEAWLKRKESV
jgi:hypothetical protein